MASLLWQLFFRPNKLPWGIDLCLEQLLIIVHIINCLHQIRILAPNTDTNVRIKTCYPLNDAVCMLIWPPQTHLSVLAVPAVVLCFFRKTLLFILCRWPIRKSLLIEESSLLLGDYVLMLVEVHCT